MEISLKSNSSITFKKSILVLNELKGNVVLQFMSEPAPHKPAHTPQQLKGMKIRLFSLLSIYILERIHVKIPPESIFDFTDLVFYTPIYKVLPLMERINTYDISPLRMACSSFYEI